MMALGALARRKNVSTYLNYWIMIRKWKILSKGASHLDGDIIEKEKDVHEHGIDNIKKDMIEIDKEIDECEDAGYKLGFRNLLLFRKSIWLLRFLARSIKDNLSKVKPELVALSRKITDKKLKRIIDRLIHRDMDVDQFCQKKVADVIYLAHQELQSEQRAVLADMEAERGRAGVSLIIRGNAKGLVRRLQLRWGPILKEKRDLRKEEKAVEVIEKELKDFRKKIDEAFRVLQKFDEGAKKNLVKELKKDEKELRAILDRLKKVFETVEDLIKASYKIFMFDMMLLEDVVKVIPKEERYDAKLMADSEIPRVMAIEDIRRLQEDQKEIHERLQNLRKFIMQMWTMSKDVKRIAA